MKEICIIMDYSLLTNNTCEKLDDKPETTDISQIWRSFADERPCVIPSIVNNHQQLSLRTNFYNLTNSYEPIRVLDYFSRSIMEPQQNMVYNPISQYPMAQVVQQPKHSSAPFFYNYPLNYLQSATDSVAYDVPASVNSVIDSNKCEVPGTVGDGTINKENSDPVDLTRESEFDQQYCTHFKKKRATVEEKANDLAGLTEGSLKVNDKNDEEAGSMKFFKHKKLNRLVKYSPVAEKIPVSKLQDEKAQRVPFKEHFTNAN